MSSRPGGWLPEQWVTMVQGLAGFTRDGAFISFAEDRLGTLERGADGELLLYRPRYF